MSDNRESLITLKKLQDSFLDAAGLGVISVSDNYVMLRPESFIELFRDKEWEVSRCSNAVQALVKEDGVNIITLFNK